MARERELTKHSVTITGYDTQSQQNKNMLALGLFMTGKDDCCNYFFIVSIATYRVQLSVSLTFHST